jgi:hypothetical protein
MKNTALTCLASLAILAGVGESIREDLVRPNYRSWSHIHILAKDNLSRYAPMDLIMFTSPNGRQDAMETEGNLEVYSLGYFPIGPRKYIYRGKDNYPTPLFGESWDGTFNIEMQKKKEEHKAPPIQA